LVKGEKSMSKNGGLTKPDISSIGIHEVFIELIVRGFKPKKDDHVRGVRLSITNPDTGKAITLIVKATIKDSKRNKLLRGKVLAWPMNEHKKPFSEPDVFYCFVYIDDIDLPTRQAHFFIMPSAFVVANLKKQHDQWVKVTNRTTTGDEEFPARFCIGVDATASYSIPIPTEAEFKNRWDLLI
jgi:hypothetical protein